MQKVNPTSARLWRRPCGVAWDAAPEPMIEYIDPDFFPPQNRNRCNQIKIE